jgi:hypothetical protein
MHTEITVFDKPIERIQRTCDLMGIADNFERKLGDLETHLEGLVADGETDADRLTVSGLTFLKQRLHEDGPAEQAPVCRDDRGPRGRC